MRTKKPLGFSQGMLVTCAAALWFAGSPMHKRPHQRRKAWLSRKPQGKPVDGANAKLTLTKDMLDSIQLKQITMDQAIETGEITPRALSC